MSEQFKTFQQLWLRALSENAAATFLKISARDNERAVSYQFSSFFRRAERVAIALRKELSLAEGERALVLTDDLNEVSLLLHGMWLAGICPVTLDAGVSSSQVAEVCTELEIRTVVYQPSQTAQISVLPGKVPVEHWVVWGEGVTARRETGVQHLDELIKASRGGDVSELQLSNKEAEGLIYVQAQDSGEIAFLHFKQHKLIEAGQCYGQIFVDSTRENVLGWSSLPLKDPEGITCTLVSPFFSLLAHILSPMVEDKLFWSQMRADGVTHALVDQDYLRLATRRGRVEGSLTDLYLAPYTKERFSHELFEQTEEKFGVKLFPVYLQQASAGPVCAFTPTEFSGDRWFWSMDFSVPSCGPRLPNVEVRIVDKDGLPVGPEDLGELKVRSSATIRFQDGRRVEADDWIATGNEGFYVLDAEGRDYFFVTGRLSRYIRRADELINPAVAENLMYTMKGVASCFVFGFPNVHVGTEVGVWVRPMVAARDFSDARVLSQLKRKLETADCPKVVIVGDRSGTELPTDNELEDLTHEFYPVDYRL